MKNQDHILKETRDNIKICNLMLTNFFKERIEKETNSKSGQVTTKTIRLGELINHLYSL